MATTTETPQNDETHLVDVRKNSTTSDGSADQRVELLISANSELKMARGDTLDAKILRGVSCRAKSKQQHRYRALQQLTSQLKNLGGQVLEDGRGVDGGLGSDTHVVLGASLKVTVNTTDGELGYNGSIGQQSASRKRVECGCDGRRECLSIVEMKMCSVRYIRIDPEERVDCSRTRPREPAHREESEQTVDVC